MAHLAREAPLDGFRAIVHASLVALHVTMLTTGHLPSSGKLWDAMRKHPVFTAAQAGGTQVDQMFMLSAYLLVSKLLNQTSGGSGGAKAVTLTSYLRSRAARLLPAICVVACAGVLMGDAWDISPPPSFVRICALLAFAFNYLPAETFGSFALSPAWSCMVDYHVGAAIVVLVAALRRKGDTERPGALARRCFWLFCALTGVSVAILAYMFEIDTLNLFKLGQLSHFGMLMTDSSYKFIQMQYGHKWKTTNSAVVYAQMFIDKMYNPTHARFGPFAVGGILACCVHLSRAEAAAGKKMRSRSAAASFAVWASTGWAVSMLLIPCLPAEDTAPPEAQLFATAALRTMSAGAGAVLLYRVLVPAAHPWHFPLLRRALSLPVWRPISTLSYCSYLIHFRLLLEMNFTEGIRRGLLRGRSDPADVDGWLRYMGVLYVVGFAASLALAVPLHFYVEKPAAAWLAGGGGAKKGKTA